MTIGMEVRLQRERLIAILLVTLASAGCGVANDGDEAAVPSDAGILYLTSTAPAEGMPINPSRGTLSMITLPSGNSQDVATNVSVHNLPRQFPQTKPLIAIVQIEAPVLGPPEPTFRLLSSAGRVSYEEVGAEGPETGRDGQLSYCRGQALDIVASNIHRPQDATVIRSGNGQYCPPMAWSPSGDLAIIEATVTDDGEVPTILLIYDQGPTQSASVQLPAHIWGGISLTWSADGSTVAFESRGAIQLFDVSTQMVEQREDGTSPAYSPSDSEVLAYLSRETESTLTVIRGDNVVAKLPVLGGGLSSFAWSSDGSFLAVVEPHRLRIFDWRRQQEHVLLENSADDTNFLPAVAWITDEARD